MADSLISRSRRSLRRSSTSRAHAHTTSHEPDFKTFPASALTPPADSANKGSSQRRRLENRTLRGIPAAVSSHHLFPCSDCKASFASKSQLQKHLVWKHSDRKFDKEKISTLSAISRSRVPESKPRSERLSKKTKLGSSCENGELTPHKQSVRQRGACLNDEDPERMRHRRKQKTPKKFTGEQPSIVGTFSLKGLGKAEEKSRGKRGQSTKVQIDKQRKTAPGVYARQEHKAPLPLVSVDYGFPRNISRTGEVICPKCKSVTRKTMAGLRKHMDVCEQLQEALRCRHCRKQFKSKAGLNYHTMAEHVTKFSSPGVGPLDEQKEKDRLRKVLKQMGKLRCPNQGCLAAFTSLMGYQYHTQRCGKERSEWAKLCFPCPDCSKEYQSKAGRDYHMRSEHGKQAPVELPTPEQAVDSERTPSGRVWRQSAQLAIFHLQEIAEGELTRDKGRRRMIEDLVPDSRRLNYLRPGRPSFCPDLIDCWKKQVKENGFICCPNNVSLTDRRKTL